MSRESEMDETIARLDAPERLEQFALNVEGTHPDKANAARRRAIELRAIAYGAQTDVERECLEAVYAYERAESQIRGKKFRAARTWPMIKKRGIVAGVEAVVTRGEETTNYPLLVEMGLESKAFEAVVDRHPESFSEEAVKASRERLRQWRVKPG